MELCLTCLHGSQWSTQSTAVRLRETSSPEMQSQGQRVAPGWGNSAAGVMLDHCGGLIHLLWLGKGSDSINAARPSSDLMMVSPAGPSSASNEDHLGHSTSESMLTKG
ncbi:hypothetical protein F7725_012840 [Dissostichus mawsoni]|uniref:Uncharacterized protein n=1 Tax=Dissostichus mawsoni TaxID=36200 RepID=A0A7J5YS08_DISMA|nr:hypothetical protein F7725_012840 [Dissostichus mawsoni]